MLSSSKYNYTLLRFYVKLEIIKCNRPEYAHRPGVAHPVSNDDLLEHDLHGVSYLDLYQGGAWFREVEFNYLSNLSQDTDNMFTEKNYQLHYLKQSLQYTLFLL